MRQENVYEKRKNKIAGQISERTDRFRIYICKFMLGRIL